MGKRFHEVVIAALEALKRHDCIAGYRTEGQNVIPEWKDGGVDRAVIELTTNPRPFGLKRGERAGLLLILPPEHKKKAGSLLTSRIIEQLRARK